MTPLDTFSYTKDQALHIEIVYSHATISAALVAGILTGHYQMEGPLKLESLVLVLLSTVKIVIRACTDPVGDPLLETETEIMIDISENALFRI